MSNSSSMQNHQSSSGNRLRRLPALAMLTAAAIMIHGLESLLPTLLPIPGIKLGLANVITLITLKRYGAKEAFLVLLARILLSCLLFGQLLSLLYSFCGGLLCMLVIRLVNAMLRGNWIFLTSISGAIAHNVAQLLVAYAITMVPGVFAYLPFLMVSAVITGLFTGLCAHFTLSHLPRAQA